jgi:hypothetical protein
MRVQIDTGALRDSKWYEYALRFAFGGTITALAGIIAKRYGPEVGGLFMAFPAIFPATATLLEDEQKQRKQDEGMNGTIRGRMVAGVDAYGASMGAIGLALFAVVVWRRLPHSSLAVVLGEATLAWLAAAVFVWFMRETLWRSLKRKFKLSARTRVSGSGEAAIHRRRR